MAEPTSISSRVLDALVDAGLVTVEQLSSIREAVAAGSSAGDVLIERGLVTPTDLTSVLKDALGMPAVDLSSYAPDHEVLGVMPIDMAREQNMLPLFEIDGMLTVAIGDPVDVFKLDELAATLGLEIEAVLADKESVAAAIKDTYGEVEATPVTSGVISEPSVATSGEVSPAPITEEDEMSVPLVPEDILGDEDLDLDVADLFKAPVEGSEQELIVTEALSEDQAAEISESSVAAEESVALADALEQVIDTEGPDTSPAVDLDVLAVADAGKVAILVTEILEDAVRKGASRVHVLPYKNDFFLVYRTAGRLEKIASAPLSMQVALVDAFKSFARLGSVPSNLPALGRLKTKIADQSLIVTVSSVPTVAGQRMVISLAADKLTPRSLSELGMTEAETKALHAMVERGRGILLLCAPVAGGRSSTYYALLAHAAHAGKTVYSVEAQIDYEIPAVAQVLVNPGSSVGAASYFAAGIRQDTDVMAIDALQTVEEIHLAVEAAGKGKLVIATFSGGDVVSGVHRMIELGAEPVSLASALTLGVGQRLIRINCPSCTQEGKSPLASKIPGAPKGMTTKAGTGCPNCCKSGFSGAVGIFEVLPFTESVRTTIARGATAAEIGASAAAAGMRPMMASGLAKVQEGIVSPEELNRVLRFAE